MAAILSYSVLDLLNSKIESILFAVSIHITEALSCEPLHGCERHGPERIWNNANQNLKAVSAVPSAISFGVSLVHFDPIEFWVKFGIKNYRRSRHFNGLLQPYFLRDKVRLISKQFPSCIQPQSTVRPNSAFLKDAFNAFLDPPIDIVSAGAFKLHFLPNDQVVFCKPPFSHVWNF